MVTLTLQFLKLDKGSIVLLLCSKGYFIFMPKILIDEFDC
jgi:hypothetical protein